MKKNLVRALSAGVALATLAIAASPASAREDRRWERERYEHRHGYYAPRYVPAPVYYGELRGAPRVYVPAPTYYAPPPAYYAPPPAVYQPAPAYGYYPQSYATPAPLGAIGGAIAGAALGSVVGHGNGRATAIAIGTVAGAIAGSQWDRR